VEGWVASKVAVVDCLARGERLKRVSTLDAVGVGPRLVAGIVNSLGHEAEVIQCEEAYKSPHTLDGYEALFVSGMSTDIASMSKIVGRWGGEPAVAGGPSFVDYEILLRKGFDFVVWGEGETSIPSLLKALDKGEGFEDVPNLIYRAKEKLRKNPGPRWAPAKHLWVFTPSVSAIRSYPGWWGARIYVEVVRGCSNFFRPTLPLADGRKCIMCDICRSGDLEARLDCPLGIPPGCGYCSVPAFFGPARSRPQEKILSEVKELIRMGVKRIVLSAPDFLDYGRDWLVSPKPLTDPRSPPPNTKAIESLLRNLTNIPEISEGKVYLMVENLKPNLVTEEVARILGLYLPGTPVNLGLESGHPEHHLALGRPSKVEEVFNAVRLLKKYGLKPYVYLIHGLPGENEDIVKANMEAVKTVWRLGVEKIILYRFTPLKGTAFEGYPKPPPAVKTQAKPLYLLVRRLNKAGKRRMVGKVVKVVGVAQRSDGSVISYMLPHGPVVLVKGRNSEGLVGKTFKVKIVRALSDRMVEGVTIRSH
jgi:threonylcarbamoyladenosine tRNA methylthiotransferase MtaB